MNQQFSQTTSPTNGLVVEPESRVNKIVPLLFAFLFGAVLIGFIGLYLFNRLEERRHETEMYRAAKDYAEHLSIQAEVHNLVIQNLSNQITQDDAGFKKLTPQQRKKKILADARQFTDSATVIFNRRWSVTADSIKTYQLQPFKGEKPIK